MTLEDRLKAYADTKRENAVDEKRLQNTIKKSKEAFWKSGESKETLWTEFLYQQAGYIQKRWWIVQGLLLVILWMALYLSHSDRYQRRCMGILLPCFVLFLLPELWKNRSNHAMEVEGAAYFSLQKIYAARLILFGMADICMLTIFCIVSAFTVKMEVMDFLIQFIVPLNMTCCICFQTLQSKRNLNIYSSLMICMGWIMVWIFLVLNNEIYERISVPVWIGMVVGSFLYLCYSVMRVWRGGSNYYEMA